MVSVEEALEFFEIHLRCIREDFERFECYQLVEGNWTDEKILEDLEEGLKVLKEAFNVYI